MCDYSLQYVASRPAKVGDALVTRTFPFTTTRGFAAVSEPRVAVCLLPGTELAFEKTVRWHRPFKLFRLPEHSGKVVRFRQINLDQRRAHHDAVELANGRIVLVTDLCEGQHAKVLQLPAVPKAGRQTDRSATEAAGAVPSDVVTALAG